MDRLTDEPATPAMTGNPNAPPAATSFAAPMPEASPVEPPKPSVFQSGNRSIGGYLQDAAAAFRPELIKFGTDAERKSAAENYIRSLEPELRARGWTGGDIKGEKLQVDGRWKDIYRDIEGTADPQYIEPDAGGPAPMAGGGLSMMGGGGVPLSAQLTGDPIAGIQQALGQLQGRSPNLEALLAQLGG